MGYLEGRYDYPQGLRTQGLPDASRSGDSEGLAATGDSVGAEVPGHRGGEGVPPANYYPQSWPQQPEDPVPGADQPTGNTPQSVPSRTSGGLGLLTLPSHLGARIVPEIRHWAPAGMGGGLGFLGSGKLDVSMYTCARFFVFIFILCLSCLLRVGTQSGEIRSRTSEFLHSRYGK